MCWCCPLGTTVVIREHVKHSNPTVILSPVSLKESIKLRNYSLHEVFMNETSESLAILLAWFSGLEANA